MAGLIDGGDAGSFSSEVIDGGDSDPDDDNPTPALPDFCWPVDTSCVTDWDEWETEPDPEADPPVAGVPVYSEMSKLRAISLAGQTLRLLTGFRVGGCPITVRPCRAGCNESTWRTYPVSGMGGSTPWFPVSLGGRWLNIGCGHAGGCSCSGLSEVKLYGPASVVTQVKIGGSVLDPTAYRLDQGGLLVRTDGDPWPMEQNLSAPDTEPDTWSVTYLPAAPVDGLGAYAAGVLAGEFVKACTGGDCRLPDNVTQIVRPGISMTIGLGAFPQGKTGIREVDSWIEDVNPSGLQAPPLVYSPDVPRHRVQGS